MSSHAAAKSFCGGGGVRVGPQRQGLFDIKLLLYDFLALLPGGIKVMQKAGICGIRVRIWGVKLSKCTYWKLGVAWFRELKPNHVFTAA